MTHAGSEFYTGGNVPASAWPTPMRAFDRPVWLNDGTVREVCPECEDGGPHDAHERAGLTFITCRRRILCGHGWVFGERRAQAELPRSQAMVLPLPRLRRRVTR